MMATLKGGMKTIVRIFRRECHRVFESERVTVRGADDMLLALQLAIAEVNKKERGDFSVALSELLETWKCLLLDKLKLSQHDAMRPDNYDLVQKEYNTSMKRSNTVDLIDVYMMYSQLRGDSDQEEPLTALQLFEFLSGHTETTEKTDTVALGSATPSNKPRACKSQVQRVVKRLFCSYLNLLVNSNNDMAVTHTLNIPGRSLGHAAFTDLKHAAQANNTSLFLALTSFIRAIQLGGKGYAPPESDPLRKHLKGLSDFVHFCDQLEEIVGESTDPSMAGARLTSCVRTALVKGRSSGDMVCEVVEATAAELRERISQIHSSLKNSSTGTGISPARPRAYAINHATAYGGREVVKVLLCLLDEEALAPPCRSKAQLLCEDQNVLSETDGPCLLTLYRSPEAPSGCSPEPLRERVSTQQEHIKSKVRQKVIRSQFACTYQEEETLPLNRILDFSGSQLPSCKHPAPKHGDDIGTTTKEQQSTGSQLRLIVEASEEAMALNCGGERHRSVLEQQSGNRLKMGARGEAKTATHSQRGTKTSKSCKRKQSNRDALEQIGEENQPPQKRPPAKATCGAMSKRNHKAPNKKLIPGQCKLTSFFRL
ncbi:PCNA-interacting partner [Chanos chanos]|uniref:PCNA-interacting partner n=1 Tax=Chanos chanos TaxID=29144 RepID=A0A6J2VXP0_CHACN|nr:PCNA-interacting partner [Chanos chanos]